MADLWKPDGTQALDPLDTWDDPTSGLVTGTNFEPEPPLKVEVPTPQMPDISEVMAAVLSDDDDAEAPATPAPPKPERRERSMMAPELSDTTPGMVAPNVRPGRPRIPMRQLTGLRARAKDEPPLPSTAGNRKPQSSGLAIGVIIALIVTVVVIAIVMIGSFLSMISTLTN